MALGGHYASRYNSWDPVVHIIPLWAKFIISCKILTCVNLYEHNNENKFLIATYMYNYIRT